MVIHTVYHLLIIVHIIIYVNMGVGDTCKLCFCAYFHILDFFVPRVLIPMICDKTWYVTHCQCRLMGNREQQINVVSGTLLGTGTWCRKLTYNIPYSQLLNKNRQLVLSNIVHNNINQKYTYKIIHTI